MIHRQRMATIRAVSGYFASVGFAAVAGLLIAFAPDSRTTAANIVAGALILIAAGLAGFTTVSAKFPGSEVKGSAAPTGQN